MRSPATGYDLSRRMRRPVGYFWSARHSQIYPELARLEQHGLVRHDPAMLRVYSPGVAEPGAARALIAAFRESYENRLMQYRDEEAHFDRDPASRDDTRAPAFSAYAALRMGIGQEEQRIAWCDWLLARLDPGRAPPVGSPEPYR